MTFQHFNSLNKHHQQQKLISKGKYVADRTTEDYQALLFELYGFFVEVTYNKQEDEILQVNGFENTEDLAPYLGGIRLASIV